MFKGSKGAFSLFQNNNKIQSFQHRYKNFNVKHEFHFSNTNLNFKTIITTNFQFNSTANKLSINGTFLKLNTNKYLQYISQRNYSTEESPSYETFATSIYDSSKQSFYLKSLIDDKKYQKAIDHYLTLPTSIQNSKDCEEQFKSAKNQQLLSNIPTIKSQYPSSGVLVELRFPFHNVLARIIASLVGIAILILFVMYWMNTLKNPNSRELLQTFQKSVTRKAEHVETKFSDVLGVDEIIDDVKTIVDYLINPDKYKVLGARMPKGVLLAGDPGTGKTLLARAIAGEAGVPFFYANGSEFDELFVGMGSKRIRELFENAKKESPCIVFIDEIDSLGFSRENQYVGSTRNDTLNQLLNELDGFEQNTGVIFLAATNLPESLDKALTRPGRFDKTISVPRPDILGRQKIIEHYIAKVQCLEPIDVESLAQSTRGMTGADLFNIINTATIKAGKLNVEGINNKLVEEAYDDILLGLERKNRIQSEDSILKTAFYKTGNAVVSHFCKGGDPIRKVTILSRGKSEGKISYLGEKDQTSLTKIQILCAIMRIFGGRIGEELFTGAEKVTTGATDDYNNAYQLAHKMVTQWGMSDKVGTICLDVDEDNWSYETRQLVDDEIHRILTESYDQAKDIINGHRTEFDTLCNALLKYETLTGEEVKKVIDGKMSI